MEVFTKYFRRLLQTNSGQIFSSGRPADRNASYDLILSEIQKLRQDPEQASKIAEAIDTTEGELFRDFDLSTFMAHFKLDPIAKGQLSIALKSANKADLRTKGS